MYCAGETVDLHNEICFLTKTEQVDNKAACSLGTVECLDAAMLQAHSFLWNYLWVAPNLYLLALGVLMPEHNLELWNRELDRLLQQ